MNKKESFHLGVVYMLCSATGLAFTGLFGRMGVDGFTLEALVFWRFFSALILCILFLWVAGYLKHGIHPGNIKMHVLRSCCVLGAQYSFYYYIEKAPLMNGVALLNMGPFFIPVIEKIFLRAHVGKSTWISLAVAFVGVLLILQPDAGIFSILSLIGLFAGFSQGASQVVFGLNSKTERSDLSVLYQFFYCALISLVPYLFFHRTWVIEQPGAGWLALIISGLAISSMVNQIFRAEAYQHGTPSRLAAFLYFSVLVAGIMDWAVFGNVPNKLSLLGAALVILGGVLKIYLRNVFLKRGSH